MDPVTHAASGVVALLALKSRPATLWSLPIAALACASPDIDLFFIHTPLEFLQLHRGITHSFAGAPVLGFFLALLAWPLWRAKTPERWSFPLVWLFCCAMILLHIWLDVVTTYGTMVFLPFSHYRVRLNAIYIIDLLITLPLLWAIWRWRPRRRLMLLVLLWIFLYPALGIVANNWHTQQWREKLADTPGATGQLAVLPDAFAPFFWRVLYEQETPAGWMVKDQSVNALGQSRARPFERPAAPAPLVRALAQTSISGKTFFAFTILPVIEPLPAQYAPELDPELAETSLAMFYDLRFGSGLAFVRELLELRPNADLPFVLMAEYIGRDEPVIERVRLRFSDSGRDSGWHRPLSPAPPDFWQWLVGLELK